MWLIEGWEPVCDLDDGRKTMRLTGWWSESRRWVTTLKRATWYTTEEEARAIAVGLAFEFSEMEFQMKMQNARAPWALDVKVLGER